MKDMTHEVVSDSNITLDSKEDRAVQKGHVVHVNVPCDCAQLSVRPHYLSRYTADVD